MSSGSSISELIGKVEELARQLDDHSLVQEIIQSNEGVVLELNTQNQLYGKGVTSTGVSIDSYAPYSKKTIAIKRHRGQPFDRVTLRDTGNFHRSFFLRYTPEGFIIDANSPLAHPLVEKYGEMIFGLTPESIDYLSGIIILPEILEKVRSILL